MNTKTKQQNLSMMTISWIKFQTTMTGTIKLLSKNFEGFYRELWGTSIYPIDEKIESICKS